MPSLGFAAVSTSEGTTRALAAFCRHIGQASGLEFRAHAVESSEALVLGARSGQFDLLWAPPLVAIELEDARVATPLVAIERLNRIGYHAALFARADAPFASPTDLEGVRVAWVSKESASGYFVPRWHLRKLGMELGRTFRHEAFLASHTEVARAVLSGDADVGATYVGLGPSGRDLVAAPWLEVGASRGDVRVLLLVGPIPSDVISARAELDAETRQRVSGAFVSIVAAEGSPAHELFHAARFDPVGGGHFSLLRELARYRG